MQNCHASHHARFRLASVSGIYKENIVDGLGEFLVRMAKHDHIRLFLRYAAFKHFRLRPWIHDVVDQEFSPRNFNGFGNSIADVVIAIAQHGRDRRNQTKFNDDRGVADIACVQDVIYAGKNGLDTRIEVAVRVRNHADFHACASSGSAAVSVSDSRWPEFFSAGDSLVNFSETENKAVNNPPLSSVLRKNSNVAG